MVRRKQFDFSDDKTPENKNPDDVFSALDCLAEVCSISRSTKKAKTVPNGVRPQPCLKISHQIPRQKNQLLWGNSRHTQEPQSSAIIKSHFGKKITNTKQNPKITPSLFLSVRTEIKKGKNVNMNYMRSDRLWTLCLRLDGAQHLKRLGFRELKAQGKSEIFCCCSECLFWEKIVVI